MGVFDRFGKKKMPEYGLDLDRLGYPYTILPEKLTDESLMQYYRDACERGRTEGFTPILIPALEAGTFVDNLELYPVADFLQDAENLDGKALLDERLKALTQPEEPECEPVLMDAAFLGTLENGKGIHSFTMLQLMEKNDRIALLEIPTVKPWEAALYLSFGGWNECPMPEEHVAILRYWHERWGAVPAVFTSDTVELVLPAPIPKDHVWDVAKEHFAYTEDCVFQGTGTLGALADDLWKSDVWYFWWD